MFSPVWTGPESVGEKLGLACVSGGMCEKPTGQLLTCLRVNRELVIKPAASCFLRASQHSLSHGRLSSSNAGGYGREGRKKVNEKEEERKRKRERDS